MAHYSSQNYSAFPNLEAVGVTVETAALIARDLIVPTTHGHRLIASLYDSTSGYLSYLLPVKIQATAS